MATLAGESKEVPMTTFSAFYPGKAIMQDSTIKVLKNDFFYMGPKIPILLTKIFIVYSFKFLIIVFYTLIVLIILGFSFSVLFCFSNKNWGVYGHESYCSKYICKCANVL